MGDAKSNAQRFSYSHPSDVPYRMGYEIPLSRIERGGSVSVQSTADPDMGCGRSKDIERSGEKRSCTYSY